MLTYLVCLLLVMASVSESTSENYILDIDYNTLKTVQLIGDPDPVLNLSGRNLHTIEKDVFNNVPDVESLDLSNNLLAYLPEFIFSKLSKLKNLSLANNQIWELQNSFVGLNNLQLLDISRNPIRQLMKSSLYGLPKSARILTNENNLMVFSARMSRNYLSENEDFAATTTQEKTLNKKREIKIIKDTESQNAESSKNPRQKIQLKLCISDGIVTTLEILKEDKDLVKECVAINVCGKPMDLHDKNITGFRQNWYRLYYVFFDSMDLSNNKIAEIEKETLNHLPIDLTYVNLQNNQIRKIRSHVIKSHNLRHLDLEKNLIEEIEGNAFAKTKLHNLDLSENQLSSLEFVSTLPDTMIKLMVGGNRIMYIPNNTFSTLSNLAYLNLRRNKIETLQNDIFQNLTSLQTLILESNDITIIEPAAFKDLTSLRTLELQHNFIRDLRTNPFAKLTALRKLDLSGNRIIKVPFTDLPRTLDALKLGFNEISALEKDSFVEVPRITLSLSSNVISRIERGAFNLPTLKELVLDNNELTTFEGDSYEGMGRLRYLKLSLNQISEIRKGSCKNFESLHVLDISFNPFQKLDAGAFYGIRSDVERDSNIICYNNGLEEIQAGLFDDI